MSPNILIYPKELKKTSIVETMKYMHLVGEVDGQTVKFIKNRFDNTKEVQLENLSLYLTGYLRYIIEQESA